MEKRTRMNPRPGGRMQRGVWAALLCAVLCMLLCGCQSAAEPETMDSAGAGDTGRRPVPEPEPEPEPEYHVHQNYMAASDGFFRPDEPLRRADCAQLLYNLTQDAPRSAEPAQYDDVLPEYWYYEAVSTMGGYLPQEEGQTCFFPSASVMPDTFLTALLSALGQTEQSASPALLQAAQALMPDGAQAEDVPAPAPITRAQAAVLVNRALGRKPDTEAINGVHRSLLLDVPEDRADYADLVEAVLPHDYYLDDADAAGALPCGRAGCAFVYAGHPSVRYERVLCRRRWPRRTRNGLPGRAEPPLLPLRRNRPDPGRLRPALSRRTRCLRPSGRPSAPKRRFR